MATCTSSSGAIDRTQQLKRIRLQKENSSVVLQGHDETALSGRCLKLTGAAQVVAALPSSCLGELHRSWANTSAERFF
jgi:hypothetical protein